MGFTNSISKHMDTPNNPSTPTQSSPAHNKTLMGVLAYIGPLVIVSYLMAKDDPFVKFHVKQGLVLFVVEIVVWFLSSMFWSLWFILNMVNVALLILAIIGIVNVVNGRQKDLPLVGKFAEHFPL